jgi:poly(beta-D-mannuronate) lyase
MVIVNCATAAEVYEQLERNEPSVIKLTGKEYTLDRPFVITNTIRFTSDKKKNILINTSNMQSVFIIGGNGNLSLHNMNINGNAVKATHFISNDSSGSSAHYNLNITNCSINDFSKENGCQNLVYAYKYMVADSLVISNNTFLNNNCNTIMMVEEKDDKGYYNAEKIVIRHNSFTDENGTLLNIYRGGNDESTLGPALVFSHNKIINCNTPDFIPLITLTGVQQSALFSNEFTGSNKTGILLRYHDTVRAAHLLERNIMNNSGRIEENSFVKQTANSIK